MTPTVTPLSPQILDQALDRLFSEHAGASDLNLTCGRQPQLEISGKLTPVALGPLASELVPAQVEDLVQTLLRGDADLAETLERTGSCDCAYALENGLRFRVNVFRARGNLSVVLRVLASEVPDLKALNLPEILEEIPRLTNGLVLVTGATGSGKSTTLAAIIDRINQTRPVHIVTLEDPIEFTHPHKMATVNQRELGPDFAEFTDGLRAALRQAPKVILVGEMRDRATLEIGLKAAETGHLVLSTLHTIDAGQTINRITGMFSVEERQLVRSRLTQVLQFVVGQRLLPRKQGGRVAALEILGSNLRSRELIQNGETEDKTLYQVIHDSRPYGWQTFDQHIIELFEKDVIDEEVARNYCSDISMVGRELDRIRTERGEDTSGLGELQMDFVRKLR